MLCKWTEVICGRLLESSGVLMLLEEHCNYLRSRGSEFGMSMFSAANPAAYVACSYTFLLTLCCMPIEAG